MTTNKKTLADVQPGGRVRLGDGVLKWNGTRTYPECSHRGWTARCDSCNEVIGGGRSSIPHVDTAAAALTARQPVGEPVCNVEGTWLWSKLMDWCKRMGAAPSNHDELFAIAKEAHALYVAPPAQETAKAVDLEQLPRAVELLSNVSRTLVDWAADEQREAIGIVKALIDSNSNS